MPLISRPHLIRIAIRVCTMVALVVVPLTAQTPATPAAAPALRTIEDLTAQWASLERPLLGVENLSDLQRDAIELLEEKYRQEMDKAADLIRSARVMLERRGPFERHDVERALQRMTELRRRELELCRAILTEAQRPKYDANLRTIAAEEAAAETKREREAAFFTP